MEVVISTPTPNRTDFHYYALARLVQIWHNHNPGLHVDRILPPDVVDMADSAALTLFYVFAMVVAAIFLMSFLALINILVTCAGFIYSFMVLGLRGLGALITLGRRIRHQRRRSKPPAPQQRRRRVIAQTEAEPAGPAAVRRSSRAIPRGPSPTKVLQECRRRLEDIRPLVDAASETRLISTEQSNK
ncbi:hypothetical protein HRR83_000363 [Exophiala dermatitidis]|uniref:Uncharacterized protein n=1 Tax=Exophiala dermatitidis TaxID=5970 RepID=A0AAN6F1M7_EXODE|nr:hypothetical protein HRR75_000328 [Exophiala dermatitidis]KAJ4527611.1 hypothetical protein HRR74_000365 [Exophiala dermatitidis]KAJ4528247.1 hypothetical protein HRR73_000869 [Exophiala dermatitidis]KAJ4531187.1 hypothetical protein HRR76_008861 [Exophiala dermatitidis]KAJ4536194.1 hypothetical protein HRR78_008633 [Exophiala dermatitidis]